MHLLSIVGPAGFEHRRRAGQRSQGRNCHGHVTAHVLIVCGLRALAVGSSLDLAIGDRAGAGPLVCHRRGHRRRPEAARAFSSAKASWYSGTCCSHRPAWPPGQARCRQAGRHRHLQSGRRAARKERSSCFRCLTASARGVSRSSRLADRRISPRSSSTSFGPQRGGAPRLVPPGQRGQCLPDAGAGLWMRIGLVWAIVNTDIDSQC